MDNAVTIPGAFALLIVALSPVIVSLGKALVERISIKNKGVKAEVTTLELLSRQLNREAERNDKLSDRIDRVEAKIEKQRDEFREKVGVYEGQIRELTKQSDLLASKNDTLEEEVRNLHNNMDAILGEKTQLTIENVQLKQMLDAKEAELSRTQAELERVRGELEEAMRAKQELEAKLESSTSNPAQQHEPS